MCGPTGWPSLAISFREIEGPQRELKEVKLIRHRAGHMRGSVVRLVLVALRAGRSGTKLLMHRVAPAQDADRPRGEPGIGGSRRAALKQMHPLTPTSPWQEPGEVRHRHISGRNKAKRSNELKLHSNSPRQGHRLRGPR